ncbi:MAG: carbohydrate kinase [Fusobacteriia bacterium 4572_132]|nr:MAG: carbohydrate kinase [Fusobacteriia bacterium 4572_132]
MAKIMCVGELLIDFVCSDVDTTMVEGENFIKKAGGAPANVSASIAKLGGESLFVGKVGKDPFGIFLQKSLKEVNVNTDNLIFDENSNTTLAFVSIQSDGERDFVFNRGADELLKIDEIAKKDLDEAKIIHLGSATALLGGYLRKTYKEIAKKAREDGKVIFFDPNYRIDLWKNRMGEFIEESKKMIKFADFVKLSEEEAEIISGKNNREKDVREIHNLGAEIVAITLGRNGTFISKNNENAIIESIKVKPIDATGAGDAFVGAVLYKIAQEENWKDMEKLKEIIAFANKVGAIVTTKYGAISSLPTEGEVEGYKS